MGTILRLDEVDKDITTLAIEKIETEDKEFNGDRYGNAVHKYIAKTIVNFCKSDERFAEVVYNTKRTLSDCILEIMKGCGNHISDFDVYQKAAQFYFPNAKLSCIMTIDTNGEMPNADYLNKETPKPKEKSSAPKKENKPSKPVEKKRPAKKVENKSNVIQLTLF